MRYLFEDYALDTARHELRHADVIREIEPQVFDLLAFLIANRDRVVTQDDLLAGVWEGRIVSESTLRSRINAARVAIGDSGAEQRLIRTIPRKGFRFVGTVEERTAATDAAARSLGAQPRDVSSETPIAAANSTSASRVGASAESEPVMPAPPLVRRANRATLFVAAGAVLATVAAAVLVLAWPKSNGPLEPSSPPSATRFDASIVPLISEDQRRSLVNYGNRPDHKAIAIAGGHLGVADAAPEIEAAKQDALRRCNAGSRRPCQLYAVGTAVVWTKESMPLPDPEDLRGEPLDLALVPDEVPLLHTDRRRRLATGYVNRPDHRAVALTLGRDWIITERQSRAEAARYAVDLCTESAQRACLVLSVDGFLTIQIPKSHKAIDVFLPSTDKDIAEADRKRIAQVYRGREWRALVRGKTGWYPVADAPSELAAVELALRSCRQAGEACQLYAIGNFRVGAE
jgi:DNA-binding winged helix-turn-helix (wHTH) protein